MSDTTNGDDGKGRGGRGGRGGTTGRGDGNSGRRPAGDRKSGPRRPAAGGDRKRENGKRERTPDGGKRGHGGTENGKRERAPRGEGGGPGDKRRATPKPQGAAAGPRPPAGRKAGPGGERRGAATGERKPFVPKSRGMRSHGGASAEGEGDRRPKSHGRLQHGEVTNDRKVGKPRGGRPEGVRGGAARPAPNRGGDDDAMALPGAMRIARRLARAGIASRRDAEGMIADGRVRVNGRVIDAPALDVTASDRIEVDGAPLPAIERTRLWLFHKQAGTVTTNRDPEGRPTVFDRLPPDMPRVLTVGRLDINTEGLLLLTNDGGLARVLELPATGWLRRYRVRAHGSVDQAKLDELRNGIAVDGVFYGAIEATLDREQGSNVWLTVGLREGKNREVKKVLGHLGLDVNRLIRLSFGPFQLGDLAEGAVSEIKGRTLRDQLGERLIEEAGADFDAPIAKPFSNKPVEAVASRDEEAKPGKRSEWISASDTARNKKRQREGKREEALGRLDTRPQRGERPERGEGRDRKPFGSRSEGAGGRGAGGAEGKRFGGPRKPFDTAKRSANVWMAPGARPQNPKKAAAAEEHAARRDARSGPRGKPVDPRDPNSRGRPAGKAPRSGGPGGAKGEPRGGKPSGPGGGPRGGPRGGPGSGKGGPRGSGGGD